MPLTLVSSPLRSHRQSVGAALATTAVLLQIACTPPPEAPKPTRATIRIITGTPGGGIVQLAEGLARAYREALPFITVETKPSPGAIANVEAIANGEAELGFVFSDVTYAAFTGRLNPKRPPTDGLRAIAALQATAVHLVVRKDLSIRGVEDLRGLRVGVGPPASGTAVTAGLILAAFGLELSDVRVRSESFDDAARHLVEGSLDAMFDDAIYPTATIRMATEAGARLMPLSGPPIDRLRHEYPFLRASTIPRNSYPGVSRALRTIGVDSILLFRTDLSESLVYELTRVFFEALPKLSALQVALRSTDLDQAAATPIPLHPGAARYYRERELLR